MVGQENTFNSSDLLNYAESLIKETRQQELKLHQNNYGWLQSRHVQGNDVIQALEILKPMIMKMSPESCTSVAVKLDNLTEDVTSSDIIIATFKNLLEEEDSITMLGRVREKRVEGREKGRRKVRPVLSPPGREPVVCFVLDV